MRELIRQRALPLSKYALKCPFDMKPEYIVVHNTANDASAENEAAYMQNNTSATSFHFAVDDIEAVQCLPLNRNGWHAGDGNGNGNRKGIGVEICYSKSGGERFFKAEKNAAKLIAWLLEAYGWSITNVKRHYDFDGKHCPHRTMDLGWKRFLALVAAVKSERQESEEEGKKMTKEDVIAIIEERERAKSKEKVSGWADLYWREAGRKRVFDGAMPQSPLTREQAAKLLYRLGLMDLGIGKDCPLYAVESWKKAVDAKVFDGTMPCAPLTRAQAALALDRIGALDACVELPSYDEEERLGK